MKKILIIEDEPVSALRLKNLMLHIDDTLEIEVLWSLWQRWWITYNRITIMT